MPPKWKRCVVAVAAKQSPWCKKHPLGRDSSGKKCANPYAVCAKLRGSHRSPQPRKRSPVLVGPRGGRYILSPSGRKVYLKR